MRAIDVKLPVTDAPQALGILQFLLRHLASHQLCLQRIVLLFQRLRHPVKAGGDARKLSPAMHRCRGNADTQHALLNLLACRENFVGGTDNRPAAHHPGQSDP